MRGFKIGFFAYSLHIVVQYKKQFLGKLFVSLTTNFLKKGKNVTPVNSVCYILGIPKKLGFSPPYKFVHNNITLTFSALFISLYCDIPLK